MALLNQMKDIGSIRNIIRLNTSHLCPTTKIMAIYITATIIEAILLFNFDTRATTINGAMFLLLATIQSVIDVRYVSVDHEFCNNIFQEARHNDPQKC